MCRPKGVGDKIAVDSRQDWLQISTGQLEQWLSPAACIHEDNTYKRKQKIWMAPFPIFELLHL